MSIAPLPSLRAFWALGGAPEAFIRRDERTRLACERVLRHGEAAVTLHANESIATLTRGIDLSGLLSASTGGRDERSRNTLCPSPLSDSSMWAAASLCSEA